MRLEVWQEQAERIMEQGAILRLALDLQDEGKLTREALIAEVEVAEYQDNGISALAYEGFCNGGASTPAELVDDLLNNNVGLSKKNDP